MSAETVAMPTLGRKIAQGAAWMVAARFTIRAIGLVSTVIIARLLKPSDFGLVSLSMAILASVDVFSNLSFDIALIKETNAERDDYDTVWTLTIVRGVFIAAIFAALAIPAAHFFNDPRMQWVMYAFAVSTVAEGFQNVGVVDFRKNLNFHQDFLFQIVGKFGAFVAAVGIAFLWRSYWALVCGIVVNRMTGVVLSYVMNDFRPRLCIRKWHDLFHFSKWLLVNNIINFFGGKCDVFVLGRLAGTQVVGFYEIAYEIANLPTGELVWPIQRALFPGYAKISEDRTSLVRSYVAGLSIMLLVALPAALGIVAVGPLLVEVFLGPNWRPAIPLLQVLSLAGAVRILQANAGSMLLALGKAREISLMSAIALAVLIPAVIVGALQGGALGVAWGLVAVLIFGTTMLLTVTMRVLSIALTTVLADIWRTLAAVAVMTLSVTLLREWMGTIDAAATHIGELLLLGACGAVTYAAVHLCLWSLSSCPDGPERTAIDFILGKGQKAAARAGEHENAQLMGEAIAK